MAAYFPTSDSQRGITPTPYVRNATEALYAESTIPGNMLYLNYSASGPENLTGNSQCEQSAIDIPPNHALFRGSLMGESLGDHQYNSWRDGRNEQSFMQALGGSDEFVRSSITEEHQMGLGAQLSGFSGQNLSLQQANLAAIQGQGLSLTLSTQIPVPSFQYRPSTSNVSFMGSHQPTAGSLGSPRDDNSRPTQINIQPSPQGMSGLASNIPNSKYLKAAQQLLDEVVNVRNALKSKLDKRESLPASGNNACNRETDEVSKSDGTHVNPQESTDNSTTELSPTERQELQNKLTKLLAMLDEVDRRYKQYYHQMQIVVSSFDVIAGCGAAKPYTALALQTISKHFRCLRDAINNQIRMTRKSLGEEDSPSKGGGISRLRYIDQHIRQQKAFQQFGMMQQHAWRPQRGLPENSVSILRAWLFEHFLHPYPKDSDKIMLARQTGLTRSQVSNWFINARVRLWKPMVEEMYKEEIGDPEMDSNSSSDNATKGKDEVISEDMENMKSTGEILQSSQFNANSKSNIRPDAQMDGATASFANDVNVDPTNYIGVKKSSQHTSAEDCNLFQEALARNNGHERLMAYQMAELGRYGNAGVSLTLGLQNFEGSLPVSDGQHGFLTMRGDEMFNTVPPLGADAGDYGYLNLTDNRHRFGPSQLLHDFVA